MSIDLSTKGLAVASSKRPWIAVALWMVLVVGAGALNATLLADALTTKFALTNNPDSHRRRVLCVGRSQDDHDALQHDGEL
jgi:hypothetical protein